MKLQGITNVQNNGKAAVWAHVHCKKLQVHCPCALVQVWPVWGLFLGGGKVGGRLGGGRTGQMVAGGTAVQWVGWPGEGEESRSGSYTPTSQGPDLGHCSPLGLAPTI